MVCMPHQPHNTTKQTSRRTARRVKPCIYGIIMTILIILRHCKICHTGFDSSGQRICTVQLSLILTYIFAIIKKAAV
jgi:hypothetical protein